MRRSWAAITVGALAIVVLGLSFLIFKTTDERISGKDGYRVWAKFRDAQGLATKSRVLAAGLQIGQIEERELDQESGKAKITILIQPKIKLYKNAMVAKKAASLIGEFYLEIDPGTPFSEKDGQKVVNPQLKDGDEIVYVFEPTNIGEIIDQVGTTLPILKTILQDVRSLTSGQVKEIADNVNELVAKNSVLIERLLMRMDNIAASIEGITRDQADDVKVAIQNIREITEGVKGLVGTSEGQVSKTGEEIRSSVQKLQRSVDSLEKSMNNIETITGRVAEGEGTVGKLVNDPSIANNVEQITEDASTFVRGLSRLQTIVGLRSEYNYLANTWKTYFSVQLMPRPDKFYLFELVDDPRGFREQSTTVIDSSKEGTVTETRVTTSEKLRITFQFGKRLGPVTGRFGIKESTGGAGIDLHLLNDRLSLSADVFDTRSNQRPRVQGRAFVSVYKRYIYLVGGVDDVLNYRPTQGAAGGFFDWFVGAQLQFNDEDLKSLLLVGGGSAASAGGK